MSKRERRGAAPAYGVSDIGRRVKVLWRGDGPNAWYEGVIKEFSVTDQAHYIVYDDGDTKWHSLSEEEEHGQLKWLDASKPPTPKGRGKARAAKRPAVADSSDEEVPRGARSARAERGAPSRRRRRVDSDSDYNGSDDGEGSDEEEEGSEDGESEASGDAGPSKGKARAAPQRATRHTPGEMRQGLGGAYAPEEPPVPPPSAVWDAQAMRDKIGAQLTSAGAAEAEAAPSAEPSSSSRPSAATCPPSCQSGSAGPSVQAIMGSLELGVSTSGDLYHERRLEALQSLLAMPADARTAAIAHILEHEPRRFLGQMEDRYQNVREAAAKCLDGIDVGRVPEIVPHLLSRSFGQSPIVDVRIVQLLEPLPAEVLYRAWPATLAEGAECPERSLIRILEEVRTTPGERVRAWAVDSLLKLEPTQLMRHASVIIEQLEREPKLRKQSYELDAGRGGSTVAQLNWRDTFAPCAEWIGRSFATLANALLHHFMRDLGQDELDDTASGLKRLPCSALTPHLAALLDHVERTVHTALPAHMKRVLDHVDTASLTEQQTSLLCEQLGRSSRALREAASLTLLRVYDDAAGDERPALRAKLGAYADALAQHIRSVMIIGEDLSETAPLQLFVRVGTDKLEPHLRLLIDLLPVGSTSDIAASAISCLLDSSKTEGLEAEHLIRTVLRLKAPADGRDRPLAWLEAMRLLGRLPSASLAPHAELLLDLAVHMQPTANYLYHGYLERDCWTSGMQPLRGPLHELETDALLPIASKVVQSFCNGGALACTLYPIVQKLPAATLEPYADQLVKGLDKTGYPERHFDGRCLYSLLASLEAATVEKHFAAIMRPKYPSDISDGLRAVLNKASVDVLGAHVGDMIGQLSRHHTPDTKLGHHTPDTKLGIMFLQLLCKVDVSLLAEHSEKLARQLLAFDLDLTKHHRTNESLDGTIRPNVQALLDRMGGGLSEANVSVVLERLDVDFRPKHTFLPYTFHVPYRPQERDKYLNERTDRALALLHKFEPAVVAQHAGTLLERLGGLAGKRQDALWKLVQALPAAALSANTAVLPAACALMSPSAPIRRRELGLKLVNRLLKEAPGALQLEKTGDGLENAAIEAAKGLATTHDVSRAAERLVKEIERLLKDHRKAEFEADMAEMLGGE